MYKWIIYGNLNVKQLETHPVEPAFIFVLVAHSEQTVALEHLSQRAYLKKNDEKFHKFYNHVPSCFIAFSTNSIAIWILLGV